MIKIRLPRKGSWPKDRLEAISRMLQGTPELGFMMRVSILDYIQQNDDRGTLWAAYKDDQLVGVATIGSRSLYPHLLRHGSIVVAKEFRRQRIGTALYFVQLLQAILEGRRQVEDTIIPALSPSMIGNPGFLPALDYHYYGTLPQRTKTFKDVQLWGQSTLTAVETALSRLPTDVTFELPDSPLAQKVFNTNLENFPSALASDMAIARTRVLVTYSQGEML